MPASVQGQPGSASEVPLPRLRFAASPLTSAGGRAPLGAEHWRDMSTLSVVVSRAEIFPGQGLFTVVHLDRGDAQALEAAVVAWDGEVTAAYEQVTLLPLREWEVGLARNDFAPVEAGRLTTSGEREGRAQAAVLRRAGLGERCVYAFAQTDEAGLVFVDPGLGIWGCGWSMSRVKGPGDAGCFWV